MLLPPKPWLSRLWMVWTNVPCLMNIWLTSKRMSQPSTIIRSMAKFFRMFSVSLTWLSKDGNAIRWNVFWILFGLTSPVRIWCSRTWIQNVTCIPDSDTYLLRHAFVWKGLLAAFWHVLEISSPHGREGCVPATRAMLWCNEVSVRRHRHTLVTYRRFNIRNLFLSRLAASLVVIVI